MRQRKPGKPTEHVVLTTAQKQNLGVIKSRHRMDSLSAAFEYVWGVYELALKSLVRSRETARPVVPNQAMVEAPRDQKVARIVAHRRRQEEVGKK